MEASTHPCHKVHRSSSVQQKRGHIDVSIVSSDVEGGETTLMGGAQDKTDKHMSIINPKDYSEIQVILHKTVVDTPPHPIIHTLL